ncbi:MAG TPA: hypothetical protein V6D25_04105 [Leptolyngbyaceae cyanobacterium]
MTSFFFDQSQIMVQEVTTWYLEIIDPKQLRPSTPGTNECSC